jgi:hypothetical protein
MALVDIAGRFDYDDFEFNLRACFLECVDHVAGLRKSQLASTCSDFNQIFTSLGTF